MSFWKFISSFSSVWKTENLMVNQKWLRSPWKKALKDRNCLLISNPSKPQQTFPSQPMPHTTTKTQWPNNINHGKHSLSPQSHESGLNFRISLSPTCSPFQSLTQTNPSQISHFLLRPSSLANRGVYQPNEPDNPIQITPTQPEKSNPKLLGWVVGFVYVNPKLLGWVVGCGSHNPTQPEK